MSPQISSEVETTTQAPVENAIEKKQPKAKKVAKKQPKSKNGAKPAKVAPKAGIPSSVSRVVAALATLKKPSTAEMIAEVMGIGKANAMQALGSAESTDLNTAIGRKLVMALVPGSPEAADGRARSFRLTKAGAAAATKAAEKAGGLKRATTRPMSMLDAVVVVLKSSSEPMSCGELVEKMGTKGLWSTPGGATPSATLNAALHREIAGDGSRFKLASKGHYSLTARGSKS